MNLSLSILFLVVGVVGIVHCAPQSWPYRDVNSYYGYQQRSSGGPIPRGVIEDDEEESGLARQDIKVSAGSENLNVPAADANKAPAVAAKETVVASSTPVKETGSSKPIETKATQQAQPQVETPLAGQRQPPVSYPL